MATFSELFCERYGVAPERYARVMFRRCMHRRAWLFLPLLWLLPDEYFLADHELIRDVARLTSTRALSDDLADFYSHSSNMRFLRRRLRLRISGRRVSHLVHRVLAGRERTDIQKTDTRFAS
jgi:hypothetical protein